MLATCPHCNAEAEFIGYGEPGSTRAVEAMMFGMLRPMAKVVDEHVANLRNVNVLECKGCRKSSNRCARCKTMFIGTEGAPLCPACHSNQTANG